MVALRGGADVGRDGEVCMVVVVVVVVVVVDYCI